MPTVETLKQPVDKVVEGLQQLNTELLKARTDSEDATADFHDLITYVHHTNLLMVTEMAKAIGRDRNYIDSAWSYSQRTGRTAEIKPSWFNLTGEETEEQLYAALEAGARAHRQSLEDVKKARQTRDAAVCTVYASKVLGPSAIARAAGIDRNHVLRIVKKAGIAPAHRRNIRNQYSGH